MNIYYHRLLAFSSDGFRFDHIFRMMANKFTKSPRITTCQLNIACLETKLRQKIIIAPVGISIIHSNSHDRSPHNPRRFLGLSSRFKYVYPCTAMSFRSSLSQDFVFVVTAFFLLMESHALNSHFFSFSFYGYFFSFLCFLFSGINRLRQ